MDTYNFISTWDGIFNNYLFDTCSITLTYYLYTKLLELYKKIVLYLVQDNNPRRPSKPKDVSLNKLYNINNKMCNKNK